MSDCQVWIDSLSRAGTVERRQEAKTVTCHTQSLYSMSAGFFCNQVVKAVSPLGGKTQN